MGLIVKNSYIVYGNRNEDFIAGRRETFEGFVKRRFGIVNLFENKIVKGRCNCDGKKDSETDVILYSEKDAEKFMLSKEATEPHIILIGDKPTNAEDDKQNDKSTNRQRTEPQSKRQPSNDIAVKNLWNIFKSVDEQNNKSTNEQKIESGDEQRTEPQSKRQPSNDIAVKNLWNIFKSVDEQNNKPMDEKSTDEKPTNRQKTEPQSKRQPSNDIAATAEKCRELLGSVNELKQSKSQPKNIAENVKQQEDIADSLNELRQLKAQSVVSAKQWEELVGSVKELKLSVDAQRTMANENRGPVHQGESQEVVHEGIICNSCYPKTGNDWTSKYIVGPRFKCLECVNFNLCSSCEAKGVEINSHKRHHNMSKINTPLKRGTKRSAANSENNDIVSFVIVICFVLVVVIVSGLDN